MSAPDGMKTWNGEGVPRDASRVSGEQNKGHQPYHPLRESLSLHPLWSFSRLHDQWETWERAARAYHSAMLWQRLPSAMLCLLRDGSVTARLDWHSVKLGLLRALMWKDPSQQHFKNLASAKLSADFNNAHLFCMDMTTYYTDIKLFDTEENTNRPMFAVLQLACWCSRQVTETWCTSFGISYSRKQTGAVLLYYLLLI